MSATLNMEGTAILERTCRICGCTDLRACLHPDGLPCSWHDEDLCSLCHEYLVHPALERIAVERRRQDLRWGGGEHDAGHSAQDWHDIVYRLLDEAEAAHRGGDEDEYRRVMIQVAAVAAAAWEASVIAAIMRNTGDSK